MPTVRKTTGRDEIDAIITQLNAIIADLSASGLYTGNALIGVDDETAVVTDLGVLRTPIVALIVDMAAEKLIRENSLRMAAPYTALVADIAEIKSKLDTLVNAYNATLAKLDLDSGVNGTDYAATNPGTLSSAMTGVAPTSTNPITQGGTAGKIKSAMDLEFVIGGQLYVKAPTDNLWDLTGVANTDASHYTAVALYLDASGTASIAATAPQTSGALALAALEAIPSTKARIGVFLAGLSTNFGSALNAQGTYYIGQPGALTLTAVTPAALTAVASTSTNGVSQATVAGKIKAAADLEYKIGGTLYVKAPTDNLWDLSALATLSGTAYRATALYLNSAGTATIYSGATGTSAAAALANLEAVPSTKARIAVFVGSPNCNYGSALDAQGTYYIGAPAALVQTSEAITSVAP